MVNSNKAIWWLGDGEDGSILWVKLGNGHWMAVSFFTSGDPPEIVLSGPSGGYQLEDYQADTFRAWLAAAPKPRVKAG